VYLAPKTQQLPHFTLVKIVSEFPFKQSITIQSFQLKFESEKFLSQIGHSSENLSDILFKQLNTSQATTVCIPPVPEHTTTDITLLKERDQLPHKSIRKSPCVGQDYLKFFDVLLNVCSKQKF